MPDRVDERHQHGRPHVGAPACAQDASTGVVDRPAGGHRQQADQEPPDPAAVAQEEEGREEHQEHRR